MERFDQELNSLFAEYRESLPDTDASANFMPRLWSRIEAKRSFVYRLRKMSQVAVAAALAVCLLGGVLLPKAHHDNQLAGTYVDVLAEAHAHADESTGGVRLELLDPDQR